MTKTGPSLFNRIALVEKRTRRGWSQPELARQAGLSQGHLSEIERGTITPRPKTVAKLATALSIEVNDLLFTDIAGMLDNVSRLIKHVGNLHDALPAIRRLRDQLDATVSCSDDDHPHPKPQLTVHPATPAIQSHPDNGKANKPAESDPLAARVRDLLTRHTHLTFHTWEHTHFVTTKAVQFATERRADVDIVRVAALLHDLNYVVAPNSSPQAAQQLRQELLADHSYSSDDIARIEHVIVSAHTATRQRHVDPETACLSDADTLYKILPITPVLYSHRYLTENDITLHELAHKILTEQTPRLDSSYYFYDSALAERFGPWITANLRLWAAIKDSLDDPDIARLVTGPTPSQKTRPHDG